MPLGPVFVFGLMLRLKIRGDDARS